MLCSRGTMYKVHVFIHPCLLLQRWADRQEIGRQTDRQTGEKGRRETDCERQRETERMTYRLPKTVTGLVCRPLYCTAPMLASASEELGAGEWTLVLGESRPADRWLSVSYPEIASKRLSGWTDLSGDVTRRGPIAGFRAWHGIRQEGAMERGLGGGLFGRVVCPLCVCGRQREREWCVCVSTERLL